MKLAPSLIMLAQSVPFAARLLPLLAAEEVPPPARWEREYASGRWSYLGGIDELAHYSVIVGYYAFLKPGGSVLDVGCGEGILQTRLSPHGYCRYLGIDFAAGAIDRWPKGMIRRLNFRWPTPQASPQRQKFDAIIFNESLYYFRGPGKYSRTIPGLSRERRYHHRFNGGRAQSRCDLERDRHGAQGNR